MKKALIAIILTVVLLTACRNTGGDHTAPHDGMSGMDDAATNHSGMVKEADPKQAGEVQAQFMLSNEKPAPNQDITIMIDIQQKNGNPIEKFDVEHEKQMHLIVVSQDLSFFNHIHPNYKGKGQFTVTTQFPTAGRYEVIADFAPNGIGAMNKSQWFTVQGKSPTPKPIVPEATLPKVVDGKTVTLSFDHLMAKMELNLNFNIKDAETKKPVTDLQPYLGAVGHVVILSEDGGNYLHVHPTEGKAVGPDAKFMAAFPHSGVFKIWGQFQEKGKVFTVPFVVKVP
jgi:hypothetical protein